MYPTFSGAWSGTYEDSFHDLVLNEDVSQDLIIFFENGEILRASDGDIVADSFRLTEYYTTEEDMRYDVSVPEMSVDVFTEVFDAKNPTGWARVYIAVDYTTPNDPTEFPYQTEFPKVRMAVSKTPDQYGDDTTFPYIFVPSGQTVVMPQSQVFLGSPFYLNPVTGDVATQGALSVDITRISMEQKDSIKVYYHDGDDADTGYYCTEWRYSLADQTFNLVSLAASVTKSDGLRPSIALTDNSMAEPVQVCMPNQLVCPLGAFNIMPDDIMSGNTVHLTGRGERDLDAPADAWLESITTYPCPGTKYFDEISTNAVDSLTPSNTGFSFPYSNCPDYINTWAVQIAQKPAYPVGTTYRQVLRDFGAYIGYSISAWRDGVLRCIDGGGNSVESIPQTRVAASMYAISRRVTETITGLLVYDVNGDATLYGTDGVVYELPYNILAEPAPPSADYYDDYLNLISGNFTPYHPQSVSIINADPSVTAGDTVTVDYGGSLGSFTFPVMAQTITFPGRCVAEYSCTASVNRNARTSADYSAMSAQKTADEALTAAKGKVPFLPEESTDLDNCTEPGVRDYLATAANKPTTGGGSLITTNGPSPYIMHIALPRDPGGTSTAFVRQKTSGGVWGPWAELLTTAPAPTWTDITSTALSAADTTKATIANLKLYACGNMRLLQGYITAVNLPTTQTTVANITTGDRPSDQVAVSCAWDSARYVTWGVVGTGGAIAIRSSTAYTSGNLRLNAMWLV